MKKFLKVQVEWIDIKSDPSWQSLHDVNESKPTICISIGYLLKIDRIADKLILGHSMTEDGMADHTVIPLGVVSRIRRLKLSGDIPKSQWTKIE